MGRFKLTYPRQRDPAEEARKQATAQAVQQRQVQTSAYAAAKFQEWQANAAAREALLNARMQQAQSQAELAGAQFRYNFWKDQELRNQTMHYYNAMPMLQEKLKQAGITPGSERYAAEMGAFASTLPDAITHNASIRKDLEDYVKVDSVQGQLKEKLKSYGLTQDKIVNPSYVAVGRLGKTDASGNPLPPDSTAEGTINFIGDRSGDVVSVDTGKGNQMARIPVQTYLEAGGKLSPEDTAAQIQAGRIQPAQQMQAPATGTSPTPASTPLSIPQAGEVRNGYTFKGGNPADQNNWEPSQ